MALLVRRKRTRNPLVFPGGNARFNPQHMLATNVRTSVVPVGTTYLNLMTGQAGTRAGSPTAAVDSNIGASMDFPTAGQGVNFTGQSTIADPAWTVAGFFRPVVTFTNNVMYCSSNIAAFTTGMDINLSGTGQLTGQCMGGSARVASLLLMTANTPHFLVISMNSSTTNFVLVDLTTGKIGGQTIAGGGTQVGPLNGTHAVGGFSTVNVSSKGRCGPFMFAGSYTSLAVMVAAASDPWSFWYPT